MNWIRGMMALLVVVVSGCATMEVGYDYNPNANFSALHTYQWVADGKSRPGSRKFPKNAILDSRVHTAVNAHLQEKGFVEITGGSPDFLVNYIVTLDQKTSIQVIQEDYGYSHYTWGGGVPHSTQIHTYDYDEGTLILDFVDAGTRELLWRGTAKDQVNLSAAPEKKQKKVNEAVRRILDRFPPQ
jgi:hypothetical protein